MAEALQARSNHGYGRLRACRHWRLVALLAVAVTSACAHPSSLAHSTSPLRNLSREQRLAAIGRAQVWTATDVSAMDLRAGPQGPGALAPFAAVSCTYVEQTLSGNSPKFTCALAPGDEVKVKYGAANSEVYGVVAASRLLWALGFGADRWYPVSVTCHGCSADPHHNPERIDGDATFAIAAIERAMPGKTIETRPDEGWNWSALELVNEEAGGAPRAQRDALKLLAAMIQHTDSKPEQQRLVCPADQPGITQADCLAPVMLIHDVGLTFGKGNLLNRNSVSGANLAQWSKKDVWEDQGRCIGKLSESWTGTLGDPVISEAGRKFLADLLVQLSDRQLRDLFEVARFPERSQTSVDDWVAVFKTKRAAIVGATCPS